MKIGGLQKFTLVDYSGKLACTIFLFGCNFKCDFCHNPELVVRENGSLSEEEVLSFLEKRKKYLDGVCIGGGEPVMSVDENFLRKIKDMGYLVKIDTNGSFPEKLKELVSLGLVDFVAMDIKSSKERYSEVVNYDVDLEKIEESIKFISSLPEHEFRTTVIEGLHSVEEVKKIAEWVNNILGRRAKKFCLQGFKNNGKFIGENFQSKQNTSEKYLNDLKEALEGYFEEVFVRV